MIGSRWTHRSNHETLVWEDLCDVARRLGMEVRQESLPDETRLKGGIVRLRGKLVFFVETRLPQGRKNQLLADVVKGCAIRDISMPPYLRELLDPHGS